MAKSVDEIFEVMYHEGFVASDETGSITRAKRELLEILEAKMPKDKADFFDKPTMSYQENLELRMWDNGYNQALKELHTALRDAFGVEQ